MLIIFGHEVKSNEDEMLQIAAKGGATIAAAGTVGSHIVDLIPPREPDYINSFCGNSVAKRIIKCDLYLIGSLV